MGSSRSADSVTVKIYMAMVRPRRSIAYVLNSGDMMSWIACCMRRLHEVRSVAAWLRTEVVSARAATNTATTPAREQQGAGQVMGQRWRGPALGLKAHQLRRVSVLQAEDTAACPATGV